MMSNRVAIVMAAGQGTRMNSELPKVLIQVRGRPMIEFVLDALEAAQVDRVIVVIGYQAELVRQALSGRENVSFVEQTKRLGTGHAVQVCRQELVGHEGLVLILAGDSPLVQIDTLTELLDHFDQQKPACLIATLDTENPQGLGRIVRDEQGEFAQIVEEKDASPSQREISEVNMSTYVFSCQDLLYSLERISNNNEQGEYYITDCPAILKDAGKTVLAMPLLKPCEGLSINTSAELEIVEAEMEKRGYQQFT